MSLRRKTRQRGTGEAPCIAAPGQARQLGGSVRTGAGWRARRVLGVVTEARALAAALERHAELRQDPHGHEPPQALRMTHGLPDATERAFRRAEGVEGDPKAISLSGGEG